ncbi:MAG TPA: NADH-quinone oxidoreductase subunit C [Streptosporangiaceae bacterium]|jgi:formate hydrogenlyase subunit 5|nr:NADH-quinone oxidoreductase subunit C [Streptosporangiaceae bacterium]
MTTTADAIGVRVISLWEAVAGELAAGGRFAGLMGTARSDAVLLSVHLADAAGVSTREIELPGNSPSYPALTPVVGAAFWYERQLHDLFGVVPQGHPRLEPLVVPHSAPRHVLGPGLFTMPHGPVRSGVMESIEYLVETPGEDIPHLNMRVFYKHRGIEKRFERLTVTDGVLLAERTEGVASVAHALAYCHAIEALAAVSELPWRAALVRVLHAELERLLGHLDVAVRLCDSAGLAVATARFGTHKERVARLVSRMCGSRFGRGVVVPGGVSGLPLVPGREVRAELDRLERGITDDARALMGTASFLDRLRGTGPLRPERALAHGALGPIGKASGYSDDARLNRPYDAYARLDLGGGFEHRAGDALARLRLRWDEVRQSFDLLRQAVGELDEAGEGPLALPCEVESGRAVGWAEGAAGEVLYDVRVEGGRVVRCRPRSPSFHNLVLFHEVFAGDILTDFPFIEASFGLSPAGVAL